MIQISVLPDGNYSIVYESSGDKSDIENNDFIHPGESNTAQWLTTLEPTSNNNFIKKTINIKPITGKLVFNDEKALNYFIDIKRNEYFFWDEYSFSSIVYDLEIDKKYPSIVNFLDVEGDEISWILPAKKYIIETSLLDYQDSFNNDIFFEKINNQITTYFDYVKKDSLINKIDINSSLIIKDALNPMIDRLPKNFFIELQPIIDFHENEFEKNTTLMNDYFFFNIELPGTIQEHNGNNDEGELSWEIDFNEIATDNFEMHGKSIIIKKWRLLISILLLLALPLYRFKAIKKIVS
ncbi:MAG: hypothetical protein VYA20_00895 [Candidatus Neomarinimicrobiota bacterium]|nr:hypothetical protein [Candidatus Neomarinimicrobiota bacterium]